MKSLFAVVETWNGEGYSEHSKLISAYSTLEYALAKIESLKEENSFDTYYEDKTEGLGCNYEVEHVHGYGAYHIIELEAERFSVLIIDPHVNSVSNFGGYNSYVQAKEAEKTAFSHDDDSESYTCIVDKRDIEK
jgi:hypothetical protein